MNENIFLIGHYLLIYSMIRKTKSNKLDDIDELISTMLINIPMYIDDNTPEANFAMLMKSSLYKYIETDQEIDEAILKSSIDTYNDHIKKIFTKES